MTFIDTMHPSVLHTSTVFMYKSIYIFKYIIMNSSVIHLCIIITICTCKIYFLARKYHGLR